MSIHASAHRYGFQIHRARGWDTTRGLFTWPQAVEYARSLGPLVVRITTERDGLPVAAYQGPGSDAPEAPVGVTYYNPATGATCAQRESRCCWPKCDPQPAAPSVEPMAMCTYPCSDPWPTPPLAAPDSPAGRDYCARYAGAPYCAQAPLRRGTRRPYPRGWPPTSAAPSPPFSGRPSACSPPSARAAHRPRAREKRRPGARVVTAPEGAEERRMATEYTRIVGERDVGFAEVVWRCARAFGALALMRDAPLDAPIPDKIVPSDHHEKGISEAKARLLKVQTRSKDETRAEWRERREKALARAIAENDRAELLRARYGALIAQAEAWRPPTPEHRGLKAFILQQLRSSIDWDCRPAEAPSGQNDLDEYNHEEAQGALRDLRYHAEKHAEELARTDEKNAWLRALRESVGDPPAR